MHVVQAPAIALLGLVGHPDAEAEVRHRRHRPAAPGAVAPVEAEQRLVRDALPQLVELLGVALELLLGGRLRARTRRRCASPIAMSTNSQRRVPLDDEVTRGDHVGWSPPPSRSSRCPGGPRRAVCGVLVGLLELLRRRRHRHPRAPRISEHHQRQRLTSSAVEDARCRMSIGIITGASRGLGLALDPRARRARLDARRRRPRRRTRWPRPRGPRRRLAVAGDVTDPRAPARLVAAAGDGIDLVVNNASALGPEPAAARSPRTRSTSCAASSRSTCSPRSPSSRRRCRTCAPGAVVVDVSSDAAVEAYQGWGGYGGSKAALDHLTAILAAEHPDCACTRSTPATCAPSCTRRRSRARTSPTGRRRRTASPGSLALVEGRCRAAATGPPSCAAARA